MKYFIILINLIFGYCLFSQSSYELVLKDHPGGLIKNMLSTDKINFIFPVTQITLTDYIRPYDLLYGEVDESGNFKEILLPFDTDTNHVFHLRPWKSGYLFDIEFTWPFHGNVPSDTASYLRCILELDSERNIVDSLCFISRGRHFGKAVIDEEGKYTFVCNESVATRNLLYGYYSDELKYIGRKDNLYYLNSPTGLAKTHDESDFLLFGFSGVHRTDSSFDLLEDMRIPFKNTNVYGYLKNLDDDHLALTGINKLYYQANGEIYSHNLITLRVFDSDYQQVWSDTMGIVPEDLKDDVGYNYLALDGALDTLNDYLYFAGINKVSQAFLTSTEENSIFIVKYKQKTGEVIWKYDQLNPDYYTVLYGVKATQDGGCLLYGFRTDPSTSIRYPYLLKLDEDGLLSTSTKPEEDASFRFTIYGNPSDQLRFHVNGTEGWQGKYQLLNTNGQVVMQDVVQNGLYTGNTSGLPGGVYIVVLLDKAGQLLTQQKWVKQ